MLHPSTITGLITLYILLLVPAASLAAQPPPKLLEPVTLVLWDFETDDALEGWNTAGVEALISSEWASHGRSSVRLAIQKGMDDVRSFDISAAQYDFPEFGDYETFALDIHNPGPTLMATRAVLLLHDERAWHFRYVDVCTLAACRRTSCQSWNML